MNLINQIIPLIQNHWADIVQVYLQVIGIASIIVRFTPTLKDDDILKGVIRFAGKYLALNTNKGSSTPNK